jgi:hypothetical protein
LKETAALTSAAVCRRENPGKPGQTRPIRAKICMDNDRVWTASEVGRVSKAPPITCNGATSVALQHAKTPQPDTKVFWFFFSKKNILASSHIGRVDTAFTTV